MARIRARSYEPDRIWSKARAEWQIKPTEYLSRKSLQSRLDHAFNNDKYLRNLGMNGRQQVTDLALQEWDRIAPENKLETLNVMRERGLLGRSEYDELASELGFTAGQSEYRYRKWSGTEESIWHLKEKGLLRRGEFSRLLNAKNLTYGQGYYRWRKYLAIKGVRSFRNFKPVPKL